MERHGAPLLDQESLASILVLLFIDDPNISTLRLYRVIRNLCFHIPTRKWIIKSLLSIVVRCNEESMEHYLEPKVNSKGNQVKWLKLRLDSALGGRANVFLKKLEKSLTIHPKASPTVCRHTLELLIFLAKSFPGHFLPSKKTTNATTSDEPMPSTSAAARSNDFWDILMRLDSEIGQKKPLSKQVKDFIEQDFRNFTESPFGNLIMMLSYEIIRKNSALTDKLLRLLSLISIVLADDKYKNSFTKPPEAGATAPAIVEDISEKLPESEEHLSLTVEVLTSKACSEDGLEDATALLINLSQCSSKTKFMIIDLLVKGVVELSHAVQKHISNLQVELQQLNNKTLPTTGGDDSDEVSRPSTSKGQLRDRFTKDAVIITAPSKVGFWENVLNVKLRFFGFIDLSLKSLNF